MSVFRLKQRWERKYREVMMRRELKEHKFKVYDIIYKGYAEVKEGDGVI